MAKKLDMLSLEWKCSSLIVFPFRLTRIAYELFFRVFWPGPLLKS